MQEDEEKWLEVRKGYLSSSEMFTWREVGIPSWWSDRPEDVLAGKRGERKIFDAETTTSIWHGSQSEQAIMEKFGVAAGVNVRSDNGFFTNDRFPGIGASIDGWLAPWDIDAFHYPDLEEPPVHPEASQDRTLMPYIRDFVDTTGDTGLLEIKKSTSAKWQKEVPEYYRSQVLTQLSVLEVDYAVIVADTIKRGDTQKWRTFWDMRAYVIERDPAWDAVLEREGKKFLTLNT